MQTSRTRPLHATRGMRKMERGEEDHGKRKERNDECEREDAQGHAGINEEMRRLHNEFPSRDGEIGEDGTRERGKKGGRKGISSSPLHAHARGEKRDKVVWEREREHLSLLSFLLPFLCFIFFLFI